MSWFDEIIKTIEKAPGKAADGISKGIARAGSRPWETLLTLGGNVVVGEAEDQYKDATKKDPEDAPVATPALPTMPTTDSELVRQARKRQAAAMRRRGGRASTILTGGSDTFGG